MGEPLPKQWEGEEGEEGEQPDEPSSRMGLESQNLRTPTSSDTVTDTASSGNGRLLPHDLLGNTSNRQVPQVTFMTTTPQDRRNRKIMRVLKTRERSGRSQT